LRAASQAKLLNIEGFFRRPLKFLKIIATALQVDGRFGGAGYVSNKTGVMNPDIRSRTLPRHATIAAPLP
jgi:hypothetical protein